ncbi:protein kinase family protein [Tumebacillus sp. DT12]|uniref:Protein kinase family protein n=1 Tax=Tumebacillus lacus TaxID=2995335 RepID=A0ABT3X156_9BACL|nr:protein kinase family protein [Tumebacillus lacus]MCX7569708.1 protein kinase family protein [Tumebacillus lacus]
MKRWLDWWRDRPYRRGRVLNGRYRVLAVLGRGSYGISYLCRDRQGGGEVVVKQVLPSRRHGAKGRPIYEYETALLAALDHPGIPRLLDKFEWREGLFFAMEYMDGPNLEDLIFADEERYDEAAALCVVRELSELVAYLHGQGIIHRDVRIPNVIRRDGQLCLIDFGLARRLRAPATQIAEDLSDYEREKQLKREVSYKSDFYSMGHFLLFLLYSTFDEDNEEERSWEEELALHPMTRQLLRRMLQQEEPSFTDVHELQKALDETITAVQQE